MNLWHLMFSAVKENIRIPIIADSLCTLFLGLDYFCQVSAKTHIIVKTLFLFPFSQEK